MADRDVARWFRALRGDLKTLERRLASAPVRIENAAGGVPAAVGVPEADLPEAPADITTNNPTNEPKQRTSA